MAETVSYHEIIEPDSEAAEEGRIDSEPALHCSADFDDERPESDELDVEWD